MEGGGVEQITGHVLHSLMQSKLAGGIVLVSWEFVRQNVATQSTRNKHFVVMECFIFRPNCD